jgi:hypothetical protein
MTDAEMGKQTREAVVRFLADLRQVATASGGPTDPESLICAGLLAVCAFSAASGHDMPRIVKRALDTMSRVASKPARTRTPA